MNNTRYLVISDIHGSMKNLKIIEKEQFDKLLILGDILPHGPRNNIPEEYNPLGVAEYLNKYKDKIICVRGNCDAEVDEMVLKFPILSLALIEYQGTSIYLTHGHLFNPENPLNVSRGIVLYGHTHISKLEKVGDVYYINPGSLSIPKDNNESYIVIGNNLLTIKNIKGDILQTLKIKGEDKLCY